jgi:uncharacterized protein (DUF4415 family)
MRFQKNHKFGFTTNKDKPLIASVCLRVDEELAQSLKSIPGWQDKLRDILPSLVDSWNTNLDKSS